MAPLGSLLRRRGGASLAINRLQSHAPLYPAYTSLCGALDMTTSSKNSTVTLFSTPGCHLCEEAHALLRQHRDLQIEVVNIRTSIELQREMGWRIPVARFGNGAELSWPFTSSQVKSALRPAKP
jgi:hypothetical protein